MEPHGAMEPLRKEPRHCPGVSCKMGVDRLSGQNVVMVNLSPYVGADSMFAVLGGSPQ